MLLANRLSIQAAEMARVNRAGLCLAVAFSTSADAMVSFASTRESRYFAVERILPPLSRHMPSFANQTETLPYSSHGKAMPVLYTNNPKRVSEWLADNIPTSNGIVGFDVESVPCTPWMKKNASFEGPATVQLATTDACLVVHLIRRSGRPSRACAPVLEAVLGDETIVKAGAGIDQDMMELWDCWRGLQARSRLDIGGIGFRQGYTVGLQRLASSILGVELGKTKRQAMSDWSQVPLTDAQLIYGARDAWAGAAIVAELAAVDPDTFGTAALLDLLKSEQSIEDLIHRAKSRKKAKTQLKSVLKPYVPSTKKKQTSTPDVMPDSIKEKVQNLRRVLAETTREAPLAFDVEPLGFKIHPEQ